MRRGLRVSTINFLSLFFSWVANTWPSQWTKWVVSTQFIAQDLRNCFGSGPKNGKLHSRCPRRCRFHTFAQGGSLEDRQRQWLIRLLAQLVKVRHSREEYAGPRPSSIPAENQVLKSIWIWDNKPSGKGSKLLFPLMKANKIKVFLGIVASYCSRIVTGAIKAQAQRQVTVVNRQLLRLLNTYILV